MPCCAIPRYAPEKNAKLRFRRHDICDLDLFSTTVCASKSAAEPLIKQVAKAVRSGYLVEIVRYRRSIFNSLQDYRNLNNDY